MAPGGDEGDDDNIWINDGAVESFEGLIIDESECRSPLYCASVVHNFFLVYRYVSVYTTTDALVLGETTPTLTLGELTPMPVLGETTPILTVPGLDIDVGEAVI